MTDISNVLKTIGSDSIRDEDRFINLLLIIPFSSQNESDSKNIIQRIKSYRWV